MVSRKRKSPVSAQPRPPVGCLEALAIRSVNSADNMLIVNGGEDEELPRKALRKQDPLGNETSTPPRNFYSSLTIDVGAEVNMGSIAPYRTPSIRRHIQTERIKVGGVQLDSNGKGKLGTDRFSVCMHKGRRKKMEDSFIAVPSLSSVREAGLYGVFDGHGAQGQECASLCGEVLKEYSKSELAFAPSVEDGFRQAFASAQSRSLASIDRGGSTACCAYVDRSALWVANVGDSRCVLSSNGLAVPLSQDHKPDLPEERKRVESQGGQVVYYNGWRVGGVLAVSRSIGDRNLAPFLSAEPDVVQRPLQKGDEFAILASDGLWGVVSSQRAVDIVRAELRESAVDSVAAVQRASEALVEEAMQVRDSTDNICCVVFLLPTQ